MRVFFALVLCIQAYSVLSDCSPNSCATSQTCCSGPNPENVGCCPAPNAVCCSDGLHCCPENTVCDLDTGMCEKTSQLIPFPFRKQDDFQDNTVETVALEEARIVYCPGRRVYCPDRNTCCLSSSGQYLCCPLPSAVCCRGGYYCCPYGTHCDATGTQCLRQKDSWWAVAPKRQSIPTAIPLPFQKQDDFPDNTVETVALEEARIVYCPGRREYCPDGNTCCLSSSGQYRCCPFLSAVCCAGGYYCCPNGTHCDATGTQCLRQIDSWWAVAPKRQSMPTALSLQ